ncbi:MAG: nucleotidyltransferase domain-containing protein [Candidatus Margulisiibacteriota bacterium]|jgi:predicted nucleotidyltransferase
MDKNQKINITQITQKIIKKFNPKLIYLFGSYAKNTNTKNSDLDILIIDEKAEKEDLALQISLALFPRNYHIDLLVYTPLIFAQKIKTKSLFFNKIMNEGKKLYERS